MKRHEIHIYAFLILLTLVGLTTFSRADNKYSIKEMTPQVKSALDGRKSRFEQLESFKAAGKVGEDNKGYVVAFEDDAKSVVNAENSDRKVVYQTIADQNGLGGEIATIEKVFAQVQHDKAQAGYKIQLEDGSWTTK